MLRTGLIALSALALAGCESTGGPPAPQGMAAYADDPRLGEKVDRVCFASSIDGFSMNERRSVVLHRGSRRYMVEIHGTCPDLDNARAIGLATPTGCLMRNDNILVTSTFGSPGPGARRCMISEIREWDPRATAPDADDEAEAGEEAGTGEVI